MAVFPTLRPPTSIKSQDAFSTISTNFEGGYKQTRERHTRELTSFVVYYAMLKEDEKNLLISHFRQVRGSLIFAWTNIDTGTTHNVRYTKAPEHTATAEHVGRYNITLEMEEV